MNNELQKLAEIHHIQEAFDLLDALERGDPEETITELETAFLTALVENGTLDAEEAKIYQEGQEDEHPNRRGEEPESDLDDEPAEPY